MLKNKENNSEVDLAKLLRDPNGSINIYLLKSSQASYDADPIYQRGNVCTTTWKSNLIEDMIRGIKISPLHLVDADAHGSRFIILDGKQRYLAICSFLNNEFTININGKNYLYKDMEEISTGKKKSDHKDEISGKLNKLHSYPLSAIHYRVMSLDDQIFIFKRINQSRVLSKAEIFMSDYPYAKWFVKYILDYYFKDGSKTLKLYGQKKGKDPRGSDLVWILRILTAMTGANLTIPKFNHLLIEGQDINKELKKFTKELNKIISNYMKDSGNEKLFDNPFENKLSGIDEFLTNHNLSYIKKQFNDLEKISNKTSINNSSKFNYWANILLNLYMLDKMNNNIITDNYMQTNKVEIENMTKEYFSWLKIKDDDKKTLRTSTPEGIKFHYDYLDNLFKLHIKDQGIKNTKPTKTEIEEALKKAGFKCEICGEMDVKKLQVDHLNSASLSSQRVFGVLCFPHNRMKQDNDLKSLDDIKKYMINHGLSG